MYYFAKCLICLNVEFMKGSRSIINWEKFKCIFVAEIVPGGIVFDIDVNKVICGINTGGSTVSAEKSTSMMDLLLLLILRVHNENWILLIGSKSYLVQAFIFLCVMVMF